MKINFYLRDKVSKVETPIEFVIQLAFTEINDEGKKVYKKIKRSTGLAIKPKSWNEKTQSARESFENHQVINSSLSDLQTFVNNVEKEFHEKNKVLTIDLLKEKLDIFFKGDKNKADGFNLISFAEHLLQNKEKKQHKGILNQTLNNIKEFAQTTKYRVDFDTVNLDFYDLFVAFLNKKNYAKNTKAKHINNVKYFNPDYANKF